MAARTSSSITCCAISTRGCDHPGSDAKVAAENIGAGYHTLAQAFSGWRDLPSHRKNMLLPGATHIGIATAYAPQSKYKVFWALILAAPDRPRG